MVSRTSIMETLDKVVYGPHVIKHKLTVSAIEKVFFDIKVAFVEHPYLSMCCVFGMAFGAFSWLRSRARRARGGHFRLDDGLGINQLKDGLLGMNGNGNQKAD
jgi:protein disulfide-isomerase